MCNTATILSLYEVMTKDCRITHSHKWNLQTQAQEDMYLHNNLICIIIIYQCNDIPPQEYGRLPILITVLILLTII